VLQVHDKLKRADRWINQRFEPFFPFAFTCGAAPPFVTRWSYGLCGCPINLYSTQTLPLRRIPDAGIDAATERASPLIPWLKLEQADFRIWIKDRPSAVVIKGQRTQLDANWVSVYTDNNKVVAQFHLSDLQGWHEAEVEAALRAVTHRLYLHFFVSSHPDRHLATHRGHQAQTPRRELSLSPSRVSAAPRQIALERER
jgi:hypothetical protein